MEKTKVKFWVDLLMFLDFLALAISGFVLWFVVPRGSGKLGASFIFLRETWLSIHDVTSVIVVVLILIHLILNWAWIKSVTKSTLTKNNRNK